MTPVQDENAGPLFKNYKGSQDGDSRAKPNMGPFGKPGCVYNVQTAARSCPAGGWLREWGGNLGWRGRDLTRPVDPRPLPRTKARSDEKSSPAALNVENGTRVTTTWCPESFKQLPLDSVAVKSRLYFAKEKHTKIGKEIPGRSHCW